MELVINIDVYIILKIDFINHLVENQTPIVKDDLERVLNRRRLNERTKEFYQQQT